MSIITSHNFIIFSIPGQLDAQRDMELDVNGERQ